jgi:ATP-dependent DNA ligase
VTIYALRCLRHSEAHSSRTQNFDAILIGDYEGRALKYVAKVRAGFTPTVRAALFKQYHGLETKTCRSITCPRRVAVSGTKD